ncbi:ceramide synthase 3-like [Ahaetulla prasina]|uniref:ceramide synthase 3-like n=1 Tax=Ahaetulla prasina TaxID=499056 RepID=UPI002649355C|nr:ceramide synthase 3-like [Ahaetulla prasina]
MPLGILPRNSGKAVPLQFHPAIHGRTPVFSLSRIGAGKRAAQVPGGGREMARITQWLLREEYWLPPGFTWEDMQETGNILYPQPHHLLLCLPVALLLVGLRFLFERQALHSALSAKTKEQWKEEALPHLFGETFPSLPTQMLDTVGCPFYL